MPDTHVAQEPAPTANGRTWVPPIVRVDGLNFFYGDGDSRNQVLFDIGLDIYPGQLIVMTGPSGSGKTTLLTLIGALRTADEGQIEILGRDLSSVSNRELVKVRRDIGFIFQAHNLFDSLTAYENVKMGLQLGDLNAAEMRERGSEMLRRLGLGHRIDYKPHSLSGGQRQRVAIARALANRPPVVFADEPTAALDSVASRTVVSLFKQMTEDYGTAVVMVTHDHRIIELADRLVHMVDGRIVSDVVLSDALRICEFLKAVEPFKALTPNELTNVAERVTRRHYEPGQAVIREGEIGEEMYLISEGQVEVMREEHEIARLGPADFFGELALMSGEPRNATVVATEPLDVYVLGKNDFREAMELSASFSDQLRRVYFQRH
jgi:putative ABC transport system ATP-binding protein